ncbi:MAG: hypothetical protein ACKO5J_07210, partial [Rubrivivax sp.]
MGLGFNRPRTAWLIGAALAIALLSSSRLALAHEGHRHPHAAHGEGAMASVAPVRTPAQVVLPGA